MDGERDGINSVLEGFGESAQDLQAEQLRLLEDMYGELRSLARALMAREGRAVTLQPTALVHEAYVRLARRPSADWSGRAHFFSVAARCMRNILVDHARSRQADKRGGGLHQLTWSESLFGSTSPELETLLVHDALETFAGLDARAARVAEMRLFGGMSVKEIATALGVSPRTVDGDWATARLWLSRALRAD